MPQVDQYPTNVVQYPPQAQYLPNAAAFYNPVGSCGYEGYALTEQYLLPVQEYTHTHSHSHFHPHAAAVVEPSFFVSPEAKALYHYGYGSAGTFQQYPAVGYAI
jgi:hypothetical protein